MVMLDTLTAAVEAGVIGGASEIECNAGSCLVAGRIARYGWVPERAGPKWMQRPRLSGWPHQAGKCPKQVLQG